MTEDEKQAAITRAGAIAIGDWLESRGGLGRPIRSLTITDLDGMAGAAISAAILARVEMAQQTDDPADTRALMAG